MSGRGDRVGGVLEAGVEAKGADRRDMGVRGLHPKSSTYE